MKKLLLLPLLFLSIAQAEKIQCKVVDITDGNTVTCLTDQKQQIKVRLYQIDAPESRQPYGQKAKQALSDMIYDKVVWMENKGTDKYKKTLGVIRWHMCSPRATISVCHIAGQPVLFDINLKMINQGYAWYYPFTEKNPEYQQAEQKAREAKRGLWAGKNPVAPWAWGKQKK